MEKAITKRRENGNCKGKYIEGEEEGVPQVITALSDSQRGEALLGGTQKGGPEGGGG